MNLKGNTSDIRGTQILETEYFGFIDFDLFQDEVDLFLPGISVQGKLASPQSLSRSPQGTSEQPSLKLVILRQLLKNVHGFLN